MTHVKKQYYIHNKSSSATSITNYEAMKCGQFDMLAVLSLLVIGNN